MYTKRVLYTKEIIRARSGGDYISISVLDRRLRNLSIFHILFNGKKEVAFLMSSNI